MKNPMWPEAEAPSKDDPINSISMNGVQYLKREVEPGRWQWVVDEDAMRQINLEEQRRRNLYWALRSRVLTDEEMREVERYGDDLNIEIMTPYSAKEKSRELSDALLQQFKLRSVVR